MMELEVFNSKEVLIAEADSRIDGTTVRGGEEKFLAIIPASGWFVVCDLSSVSYICRTVLRVIFIIAKHLIRNGISFSVCGQNGDVAKIFRISGFDKIILMYANREDAMAAAIPSETRL